MIRTFIESKLFQSKAERLGGASLLLIVQNLLLESPGRGDLVTGTGGIRKMRVADLQNSKGKSGGLRVLYLDLPKRGCTYLITLFGKSEKANISKAEKAIIQEMVKQIKNLKL